MQLCKSNGASVNSLWKKWAQSPQKPPETTCQEIQDGVRSSEKVYLVTWSPPRAGKESRLEGYKNNPDAHLPLSSFDISPYRTIDIDFISNSIIFTNTTWPRTKWWTWSGADRRIIIKNMSTSSSKLLDLDVIYVKHVLCIHLDQEELHKGQISATKARAFSTMEN